MQRLSGVIALMSLSCLTLSSGCAGIVSSKQMTRQTAPIPSPTPSNAYYFLPMVKIRLIAERKPINTSDPKERVQKTQTTEVTEDSKTTKKKTVDTTDTEKTKTEISPLQCTLTLKETLTEPDPRRMFNLSHIYNILADDQVTITMDANGLLEKVETTS